MQDVFIWLKSTDSVNDYNTHRLSLLLTTDTVDGQMLENSSMVPSSGHHRATRQQTSDTDDLPTRLAVVYTVKSSLW